MRSAWAALLEGLGRLDEAERINRRALRVFRKTHGEEHYDIAVALNNLASVCQARGEIARAARYYRRALAMKEKLLGPKHVDVATTLNMITVFLLNTRGPGS